jgi:hypothetical protein
MINVVGTAEVVLSAFPVLRELSLRAFGEVIGLGSNAFAWSGPSCLLEP